MITKERVQNLEPHLTRLFRDRGAARCGPMPPAAEALLAGAAQRLLGRPVLVVTDGRRSLDRMHQDLETLFPDEQPLYLPERESFAPEAEDPDVAGERLAALLALREPGRRRLAAVSVQALLQRTVLPDAVARSCLALAPGAEIARDALLEALSAMGYRADYEVVAKGRVAARGGMIDLWPPVRPWPVRVEMEGDAVASLRSFDPSTQRSRERLDALTVTPASESALPTAEARTVSPIDILPDRVLVLWSNIDAVRQHALLYEESAADTGAADGVVTLAAVETALAGRADVRQLRTGDGGAEPGAGLAGLFAYGPGIPRLPVKSRGPDLLEAARRKLTEQLLDRARRGYDVTVFFATEGAETHFRHTLPDEAAARLTLRRGALSGGFLCEALNLVVAAESDIYGARDTQGRPYAPRAMRGGPARVTAHRIGDLSDLEPGDLVVHVEHGLGRYRGLSEISVGDKRQEVLTVEYADNARLHLPVWQAHLLSRYVGVTPHKIRLHRLGGRRWNREKDAATGAIMDFAGALLELQAERALLSGHAFPPDTPWQREFEAAFPYTETPDQAAVVEEVRADLENRRPMDRLICGDAGYGKTEVAMRAAFKCVMDSRQVAVLVPTTVLAQQHVDTFRERMAGYPFRIAMLSRFCTAAEKRRIVEETAAGEVDILVGTHALLQPGVHFDDLGLVIIDEEQRFGVAHKEQLKELRRLVDVLTMTATPIPRTLYLSLTGGRDISLLQTPPRERMAIETIAAQTSDEVIRGALLREINREGQAFFVHNRILTIERVRERLRRLVPEATFAVAHGRMAAGELEAVMHRFVSGGVDVLICTTIIESGLDIPQANTILIDRADRFGIADLYQLRGRVGRSSRKAYAYLLLPERGFVEPDARRRIEALQRHAGLSAGFHLALRDLEIRGAGNLLGAAQSGHINTIGFGLYCQLLQRTLARLKNEPPPPLIDVTLTLDFISLSALASDDQAAATIPYDYIEDERLRVETYRRLAGASTTNGVAALREDLADRFGPVPDAVRRLLAMAEIRVAAAARDLVHVETRGAKVILKDADDYITQSGRFPRLRAETPDAKLAELLALINQRAP